MNHHHFGLGKIFSLGRKRMDALRSITHERESQNGNKDGVDTNISCGS